MAVEGQGESHTLHPCKKRFGSKLMASAACRGGQSAVRLAVEREERRLSRRRKPYRREQPPHSCQEQSLINSVVTLCQSERVVRSNAKEICSSESFSAGVRLGRIG